jgi:hypothetical protein
VSNSIDWSATIDNVTVHVGTRGRHLVLVTYGISGGQRECPKNELIGSGPSKCDYIASKIGHRRCEGQVKRERMRRRGVLVGKQNLQHFRLSQGALMLFVLNMLSAN